MLADTDPPHTHAMPLRLALVFPMLLLCIVLAGCASTPPAAPPTPPTPPAPPSQAPVTIAVPGRDNPLAQRLRRKLSANGWRLVRYDPQALQSSRNYGRLARTARYRLTLSATRIAECRDGDISFRYNLALIDNASGDLAMALTGTDCLTRALARFEAELDRRQLSAARARGRS